MRRAEVLADSYTPAFHHFADFHRWKTFFTIAEKGENFICKVFVTDGEYGISRLFPGFIGKVELGCVLPGSEDFAYASFSISRMDTLDAYKKYLHGQYAERCVTDASHNLWVFDLRRTVCSVFADQQGMSAIRLEI